MTIFRLNLLVGAVLFTACMQQPAGADRPTSPGAPPGRVAGRPDLATLIARLDSPQVDQAIEAAEALAREPSAEAATVEFLTRKLASPEEEVREKAVLLLGRTGFPSAIPVLIRALADPEHNVRTEASGLLRDTFDASALAPLMASLESPDALMRSEASLTLRGMGPEARAALPRLRVLAEEKDVDVQFSALLALGDLSREDEDKAALLPLLLLRLQHENPLIRETAVFVLHRSLGQRFPQVIPHLIRALSDENSSVQVEAAFALGDFGPAAWAAVPRLRQLAAKHVCFPAEVCVDVAAHEALRRIKWSPEVGSPRGREQ